MKIHKKILKSRWAQSLISWFAANLIRSFWYGNRWQYINRHYADHFGETKTSFLAAFWHSRILMMPFARPKFYTPFFTFSSQSRDGQLIVSTVKRLGIGAIFGSSQKGGARAYMEARNILKGFSAISITPDGPKGPAEKVKPGIIHLAQKAGVPIVPGSYATSRKIRTKSWDRLWIPLWFGRGVIVYGKPFYVPKDDPNIEKYVMHLESVLKDLTQQAENFVSQPRRSLKNRCNNSDDDSAIGPSMISGR